MKLYHNVRNESKKERDVRFLTTVGIIIHTPHSAKCVGILAMKIVLFLSHIVYGCPKGQFYPFQNPTKQYCVHRR